MSVLNDDDRHEHATPELDLWGAVLRQAVRDAVKGESSGREWLDSDAVEVLCETLGLDVTHFRQRAWRAVARHQAKRAEAKLAEAEGAAGSDRRLLLLQATAAKAAVELAAERCNGLRAAS